MQVLEGNGTAHDVIAIRAVRVSDYNGCSVNSTRSSIVSINPVLPEATKLKVYMYLCVCVCVCEREREVVGVYLRK